MTENEITKLIEEAFEDGRSELKLRSKNIISLPDSIGKLTNLTKLDLSENKLTSLPYSIGNLTKLTNINLKYNQLSSLPESIGKLTDLTKLNLSQNKLTSLSYSIGNMTKLTSLRLNNNQLTSLPESISNLTNLTDLWLYNNQLAFLPQDFNLLFKLETLYLDKNPFKDWQQQIDKLKLVKTFSINLENEIFKNPTPLLLQIKDLYLDFQDIKSVPESIGNLTNLTNLVLSNNQITYLPKSIGNLTNLNGLGLANNKLTSLPESIGNLINLTNLNLRDNKLTSLPESIANFTNLTRLELGNNQLTSLPKSIGNLTNLINLNVRNNPLNKAFLNASNQGSSSLLQYLKELNKNLKKRYESKLILLGDGGEGKTCVSRALRGKPFKEQVSTKGVEVIPWNFSNPKFKEEANKEITLNIWDFEGQEIHHQTHQFFLTEGSIYILVFKCREIFRMDRAEYWLDTISSRAPDSRVFLVITECEERQPLIPLDKLKQKYPKLLGGDQWFFPVGCLTNYGIQDLRTKIQTVASELDIMGVNWPQSYFHVEEKIASIASKEGENRSHLTRKELEAVFIDFGIDKDNFKYLAKTLGNYGLITQFPDCLDLADFIVINPQWLTKAISAALEDRETVKGEIQHARLKALWETNYPGLYTIFHDCMKEFELCYELEKGNSSLIPLRFDHIKPSIPWSLREAYKEREVQYKLNLRPPMGLMSRFIVKVHHLIVKTEDKPKGIYWHNGVFLKTGREGNISESLCQFDSENKTLSIIVRSAFPQNMIEQLHGTFSSVLEFYEGLKAERFYGCIQIDDNEKESRCEGLHTEDLIIFSLSKNSQITCAKGLHEVSPEKLLYGFTSSGRGITKKELKAMLDEKPAWAKDVITDLMSSLKTIDELYLETQALKAQNAHQTNELKQQIELSFRNHLINLNNMLDDRDYNPAPSIVSISLKDKSNLNPKNWFNKELILTPYCECGNEDFHKVEDAIVNIKLPKDWWQKTAPKLTLGFKILVAGISIANAGLPLTIEDNVYQDFKYEANFTKELANQLKPDFEIEDDISDATIKKGRSEKRPMDFMKQSEEDINRIARRQLAEIFKAIAPVNYESKQWGSLRRVYLSDSNTYRWLCERHRENR